MIGQRWWQWLIPSGATTSTTSTSSTSTTSTTPAPTTTDPGDAQVGNNPLRQPFNLIFIIPPATPQGITSGHQNWLPVNGLHFAHYFNGTDTALMADPVWGVSYHIPDPASEDWAVLTLEKTDGSGDTESWPTCLARAQQFNSLRPNVHAIFDLGTLRGYNVDHPGAGQEAALADLASDDAQTFYQYLIDHDYALAPQCYPYDGADIYTFVKTLVDLYKSVIPAELTFVPVVSRRKLTPMWPSVAFWTEAEFSESEDGLADGGVDNRILFDAVDDDDDVEEYVRLLTLRYGNPCEGAIGTLGLGSVGSIPSQGTGTGAIVAQGSCDGGITAVDCCETSTTETTSSTTTAAPTTTLPGFTTVPPSTSTTTTTPTSTTPPPLTTDPTNETDPSTSTTPPPLTTNPASTTQASTQTEPTSTTEGPTTTLPSLTTQVPTTTITTTTGGFDCEIDCAATGTCRSAFDWEGECPATYGSSPLCGGYLLEIGSCRAAGTPPNCIGHAQVRYEKHCCYDDGVDFVLETLGLSEEDCSKAQGCWEDCE